MQRGQERDYEGERYVVVCCSVMCCIVDKGGGERSEVMSSKENKVHVPYLFM